MASDPLPFNLHDQLEPLECNSRQTRRGSASPQSAHTSSYYDFCIWKVDNESAHLAYSLLELTVVRSGSFSLSKDFADTDIQIMIVHCLTV